MLSKDYQNLIYGIFERAFEDYNDLRKRGVSRCKTKGSGDYSITEIRKFLRSGYCNSLLCGLGRENDPQTNEIINRYITGSIDERLCKVG